MERINKTMIENEYLDRIELAAKYISNVCSNFASIIPSICIVLGSGLAPLASMCEVVTSIPYSDIPGFPQVTVPGHEGRLILGKLSGKDVFLMSGRFHYYEGNDYKACTFYVRVLASLGVSSLFLTNAAGGLLKDMEPADLMVISDHLSFNCDSPLRGENLSKFGPRFPDQTNVYDKDYVKLLHECAQELSIRVHNGVYSYSKGPQYETPAEIYALKQLGVGAVGMSTVPEAIVASHCGMKVAAVSCITNLAAGISLNPISHNEVLENASKASSNSCALVKKFIERI